MTTWCVHWRTYKALKLQHYVLSYIQETLGHYILFIILIMLQQCENISLEAENLRESQPGEVNYHTGITPVKYKHLGNRLVRGLCNTWDLFILN